MFKQQVLIFNNALMVIDGLCVIAAGYGAYSIKSYLSLWLWSMSNDSLALSILFTMFINYMVMEKARLYSDDRMVSYSKLVYLLCIAVVLDFVALAATLFLLKQHFYSREFLLLFGILTFTFLLVERIMANLYVNQVARKGFNALRLLVVGDQARGQCVVDALNRQLSLGHRVVGHYSVNGNGKECAQRLTELPQLLKEKGIDEVIFAIPKDREINLNAYLELCLRMGIPARVLPALWENSKSDISVEECQGLPFLTINFGHFSPTGLLYKRMLDLVGSSLGLLVLAITYPFIAAAIKLNSPGPVLFKQDRVGRNGRVFKLYKFRSMYTDAEERKKELMAANMMDGPMFKLQDDPRITRVGRFLRKTSLDELPQVINIFTGRMSLVGTRPPTLNEVQQYDICHYKRISVKPGLTGMWQISGRNKVTNFDEVVRLDCQYIDNWRFITDIQILAKTFWVVLDRKGAF